MKTKIKEKRPNYHENALGVNCRLRACSRLRHSRACGIEKARTRKKGRKLGRGGAVRAFHFRVFPILSRLPQKHLNWLTCNFASCRKRTQTCRSFICRFGLHWIRADYNVWDGKKLFLSSCVFVGSFNSYELFIIPRLDGVIYNSRFSNSKYSLFIFF